MELSISGLFVVVVVVVSMATEQTLRCGEKLVFYSNIPVLTYLQHLAPQYDLRLNQPIGQLPVTHKTTYLIVGERRRHVYLHRQAVSVEALPV